MAGHALNPNRDVKARAAHSMCGVLCGHEDSQSPNLRSSVAMYPETGCNTAGVGLRSAPSDHRSAPSSPADDAVAQNDLPASCATGPSPVAHPASRSMTSPHRRASVTVMITDQTCC